MASTGNFGVIGGRVSIATSEIFHGRTSPSRLPESVNRPDAENVTATSESVCLRNAFDSLPVAMSHSRTVASAPPESVSLPSDRRATARTAPVWPTKVCVVLPVSASHARRVPSSLALRIVLPSAE